MDKTNAIEVRVDTVKAAVKLDIASIMTSMGWKSFLSDFIPSLKRLNYNLYLPSLQPQLHLHQWLVLLSSSSLIYSSPRVVSLYRGLHRSILTIIYIASIEFGICHLTSLFCLGMRCYHS